MSKPAYGGPAEAQRLSAIHSQAESARGVSAVGNGGDLLFPTTPACDYCSEGDSPVEGFHLVFTDEYDLVGTWSVPCPRN